MKTDHSLDETYTYDDLDRLVEWARGGTTQKTWTLDSLGNNLSTTTGGTYNAANEETSIAGSSVTPTYDAAGNMILSPRPLGEGQGEGSCTLVYDAWNRLVKVTSGSGETLTTVQKNEYDGVGRRVQIFTDYDAAGTPTYDAAGNMTTLSNGDAAVYDAWNRLVKVTDSSGTVQQNEYDGTNRRVQIYSSFDSAGNPTTVEDDYYSGQQVIESYHSTPSGTLQSAEDYIWSPRYIDSAILRDTYNSSGSLVTAARVYYLADANYNVTGLVKYDSNAQQWNVVERYTYTPYGEVTYCDSAWAETTFSANSNTVLYTGRTLDTATDLYYNRARYYDASLERFISRDPIAADANLYRYCANKPLTYVDPSGAKHYTHKVSLGPFGYGSWISAVFQIVYDDDPSVCTADVKSIKITGLSIAGTIGPVSVGFGIDATGEAWGDKSTKKCCISGEKKTCVIYVHYTIYKIYGLISVEFKDSRFILSATSDESNCVDKK